MAELKQEQSFETAMQKLEEIVAKLELGDVALEEAVQLFQEGMTLAKLCHDKLQKVEQQVQILTEKNGEPAQEEFHIEEADE